MITALVKINLIALKYLPVYGWFDPIHADDNELLFTIQLEELVQVQDW